jgi:hypothetical protein
VSQAARRLDEERYREVAGNRVCVHRQSQRAQPMLQVRFPYRLVPLDLGRTEYVIHNDVQAALLALDPSHERAHLIRHEMVDTKRNSVAAGFVYQRGGLFDGFWSVHLRARGSRRAPGTVHSGSARAQFDRDSSTGSPRRTCDHGHFSLKRMTSSVHMNEFAQQSERTSANLSDY